MPAKSAKASETSLPIQALRNLGPACQRDLQDAGIHTAQDLERLGPKEAFIQVLVARRQQGRSTSGCNALYLYALHGAIHDVDWRELPEPIKQDYLAFAAELRAGGAFKP